METTACANCGTAMADRYCPECGQKRFVETDRRFGHLLASFFEAATDLDGRFWRSLRALLFQPGRIARDYIDGARQRWMSPIALFLLANLLYFLMPTFTDLSLPLHDQIRGEVYREFAPSFCEAEETRWRCGTTGQLHSRLTEPLVRHRLQTERERAAEAGREFSIERFAQRYDARSGEIGKLLVILHVPFMALALMLAAWRRRRYFAEHFVVALTQLSFVLLFLPLVLHSVMALVSTLPWQWSPAMQLALKLGVLALVLLYFALACRRCYDSRWWSAACQAVVALGAFALSSFTIYRAVQFVLTIWLA
ncbi:DUF3667 domain-containing protein [Xanthomonadaceae bacterium JHOS43]|nr:DUF3667 domain-containing protein [Xanthomonadaceae bacterium JHOS43]